MNKKIMWAKARIETYKKAWKIGAKELLLLVKAFKKFQQAHYLLEEKNLCKNCDKGRNLEPFQVSFRNVIRKLF